MNNNQKHLSLGNLCRVVKELSQNKSFANQTEIFYTLFNIDNVSDSTVNNYCIGYRSIGTEYRQIYIKLKKEYQKDESVFDGIILGILSILDGQVYNKLSHNEILKKIENHILFNKLNLELYNLAKNDESVSNEFTKKIHEEDNYNAFCDLIIYIILEKKQPIYIENSQKEIIENLLNNTNISISELEKFLKLQMQDGINYTHSLKSLAKEGNPYACYEMGEMEYKGLMTGQPRYIKSYEYFKIAALKNHPRSNWLIAQMFYQKKLGHLSKKDLETAYDYLKRAERIGSVAAINTLGVAYLEGLIPNEKKDEKKAISYFQKAMTYDYVYAYNNMGKIYESKKEFTKAFECYMFSALKEESWACNKVGEFYRLGLGTDKDEKKAFDYYNLSTEVPIDLLDPWAYYNLAKYYYLTGNVWAEVNKDVDKALKYFELSFEKGVKEALKEILYIYIDKYKESKENIYFNKINEYLSKLDSKDNDISNKLKELEEKHLCLVKLN